MSDPFGERAHVVHVVAREHDRCPCFRSSPHEPAYCRLDLHVEPDRRLVEKQHPRTVEQRRRELAPIRWPSDRFRTGRWRKSFSRGDHELVDGAAATRRIEVEQRAVQEERVGGRQFPQQLLLLAITRVIARRNSGPRSRGT